MKETIKRLLKKLPIAFTRNQQYDRQTTRVIRRVCRPDSNCIDVGCHKGEVLDIILQQAPQGRHMGFEPIPSLYEALRAKYTGTACTISNIALSDAKGRTTFNYVVSNPSYSGLRKRQYDHPHEQDTTIEVQTDTLDHCWPPDQPLAMIKIDVEGGELPVLRGAVQTLKRHKPVVIFEHGLGASEFYGATPEQVYDLLADCGLQVTTMKRWLDGKLPFTREQFCEQFYRKINYYFLASAH